MVSMTHQLAQDVLPLLSKAVGAWEASEGPCQCVLGAGLVVQTRASVAGGVSDGIGWGGMWFRCGSLICRLAGHGLTAAFLPNSNRIGVKRLDRLPKLPTSREGCECH